LKAKAVGQCGNPKLKGGVVLQQVSYYALSLYWIQDCEERFAKREKSPKVELRAIARSK
jgi:hypothetical protein